MVVIKSSNENIISALAENYKDAVVHATTLALQVKDNADVKALLKTESAKYENDEIEMEILEYGAISGLKFKKGNMSISFPTRHATQEEKEARKKLLVPEQPAPVEPEEPFLNSTTGYIEVVDPDDPFLAEDNKPESAETLKTEPQDEAPALEPDVEPDAEKETEEEDASKAKEDHGTTEQPVTENDLIHFLKGTSPNKKVEIQSFLKIMKNNPDKKASIDKLKTVYGNGGCSHRFEDGETGFANYSSAGLELRRDKEKTTFTWSAVFKAIENLIENDEYVSDEDKQAAAEAESLKPSGGNNGEKEKKAEFVKADPDKHKVPPLKDVPDTTFTVDDVREKLEETRVKYAGMEDFEWAVKKLIEMCETDKDLCQYIMQEEKTFDNAFDYLKKLCQKKEVGVSNGNAGSVSREKAIPVFIEYYKMDEEAVKAQEEAERKRKQEEQKAKAAEEKKKKKKSSKPASSAPAPKTEAKLEPTPSEKQPEMNAPSAVASAVSTVSTDDTKKDVAAVKAKPVAKKKPAEQVSIWDML